MRKLLCPQCKVSSMYVKNGKGERRAVYVTDGGVVVARKEGETLDGFDLETVYCMGCSWGGVLNVSDSETEILHNATGTRQWRSLKYSKRILALSPCAA